MTSKPASRKALAMTLAPRSWPSRPGLPTSTRILRSSMAVRANESTSGAGRRRPRGAQEVTRNSLALQAKVALRPGRHDDDARRIPFEPGAVPIAAVRDGGEAGPPQQTVDLRGGAQPQRMPLLAALVAPAPAHALVADPRDRVEA